MAYIGDYLGQIMAEVTMARMQADLEAIRIAELYASHPLLKNMPVPRFRLPNMEIDVPVVIKNMEIPPANAAPRGAPGKLEMKKAYDIAVVEMFKEQRIKLTAEQLKKMKSALDRDIESISFPDELAVNTNAVADRLALGTITILKEFGIVKEIAKIKQLTDELKVMARAKFHQLRKPPSRLEVLVTSAEIKEAGPKENITMLRLKIIEEGYEWTTIETEEGTTNHLVIE